MIDEIIAGLAPEGNPRHFFDDGLKKGDQALSRKRKIGICKPKRSDTLRLEIFHLIYDPLSGVESDPSPARFWGVTEGTIIGTPP